MNDKSKQNHLINNYRHKKFGNEFLVTTDHGSWIFLSEKEFEKLKKDLIEKDSEFCKKLEETGIIITTKNIKTILRKLEKRNDFLYQGTSLHIVIPTLRCNQKCIYCHASSKSLNEKKGEMDEETAKKVIDFIFQSPSEYIAIEFQGGEPLLNFKIVSYMIHYAKKLNKKYKKNLIFRIVSNFSILDEEKLNFLIKENVGICTSLDGPNYLHNKNRPFANKKESHHLVEKGIQKLNKKYKKNNIKHQRANALITITKYSLQYPKEIIDEYVGLGLKDIHLRFLNNLGDARQIWDEISYSCEEFMDFWKKSIDYILEMNKKGVFFRERGCLIILQKILTETDPNFVDIRSPCGAAIEQLSYTPEGDIFSCDEARMVGEDLFKLGNVKKDTYRKIISSNQTCSLVASSINDCQICDYCVYKPYCGICPVCNFVEQGSIIAKTLETPRCKIYKAQFTYLFEKLKNLENKKIFQDWINKTK